MRLYRIGASAGGVEATLRLAAQLPPDLPAAVFIVVHISPLVRSVLTSVADKRGALPAAPPRMANIIVTGRIYVAPPDHHVIWNRERARDTRAA